MLNISIANDILRTTLRELHYENYAAKRQCIITGRREKGVYASILGKKKGVDANILAKTKGAIRGR
jgi:hypothetical protein